MRDLGDRIGITERAVQLILNDLASSGYLERKRTGRRNSYRKVAGQQLRHPVEAGHSVDELVPLFSGPAFSSPVQTASDPPG